MDRVIYSCCPRISQAIIITSHLPLISDQGLTPCFCWSALSNYWLIFLLLSPVCLRRGALSNSSSLWLALASPAVVVCIQ